MSNDLLKKLPNMNSILGHEYFKDIEPERVKRVGHELLEEIRKDLSSGVMLSSPNISQIAELVLIKLDKDSETHLRGVINATGVVLHTNLGRAPLGAALMEDVARVYQGYSNLEFDLDLGERGSRHAHVQEFICELTGADAAMVVNNNAAAVLLMLAAIAKDKNVAVSRGELVEIGGSFRIPDIIKFSGAVLKEVGTTNRTRLSDYIEAVEDVDNPANVLLKVHTSNYEIVGFTESTSVTALSEYGNSKELPVLYDMGTCFLVEPQQLGLRDGETAKSAITAGVDVICFSGDKLVGATQCGIIAGKKKFIDLMKKHPLARAMRADKLTIAALEVILRLYRFPDEAKRRIPTLAMLSLTKEQLKNKAEALAAWLRISQPRWDIQIVKVSDEAGGGALPTVALPGWAVTIKPVNITVPQLEQQLRNGKQPIIARINEDRLLLSVRTIMPGEDEKIIEIFSMFH